MTDPSDGLDSFMETSRRFHFKRDEDESGVSGTGIVFSGVEFPDGSVAYKWHTEPSTVQIADSIDDVAEIHGHSGKGRIVWEDPEVEFRD